MSNKGGEQSNFGLYMGSILNVSQNYEKCVEIVSSSGNRYNNSGIQF